MEVYRHLILTTHWEFFSKSLAKDPIFKEIQSSIVVPVLAESQSNYYAKSSKQYLIILAQVDIIDQCQKYVDKAK